MSEETKKTEELESKETEKTTDLGPGVPTEEDREVICPSCFRFVGTYEKCPYCGAEVYKRISVRAFRWGSLLFAFIGLFLLWMAARGLKAPLKKIYELKPTMSMGLVRVVGRVTNDPRLHPEWKSLYVKLDDGSGEISVNAYKEVAVVIEKNGLPRQGDTVSVQGMVRFQTGGAKILCQAPQHMEIVKKAARPEDAKPFKINQVTEAMEGKHVIVEGKLTKSGVLSFGAYSGTLKDETGDIIVWVEPFRWKKFPSAAKSKLATGAELRVRGKVTIYRKNDSKVLEVVPDGQPGSITALK